MIKLSILGASGSIGRQTLEVASWHPEQIDIVALAAGSDWRFLAEAAHKYHPQLLAVADESCYAALCSAVADLPCRVVAGDAGLAEAAACETADTLLAAISGMAGIRPLIAGIEAGKRICLANKEPLVSAGHLLTALATQHKVEICPVDSEHSAIWQCLAGEQKQSVSRLVLTASGGALRDFSLSEMDAVTPAQALQHPNWKMGPKIVIDCATMVNKGLEVIEAHWLFGVDYDNIDVLIHPQSIIHSMVEFADGSTKAQLAQADMRLPIQYALFGKQRPAAPIAAANLAAIGRLDFFAPDAERYPAFAVMRAAGCDKGAAPAYINAANEQLVQAFLHEEISFPAIAAGLAELYASFSNYGADDFEAVFAADAAGRSDALRYVKQHLRR